MIYKLPVSVLLALVGITTAQIPKPVLLRDINTTPFKGPASSPTPKTWDSRFAQTANKVLFFQADDGTGKTGIELYTATLIRGSARMVKDIFPGPRSSSPNYLTTVGNKVFFQADDGKNGVEPWVSDGTTAGTFMLTNYGTTSNQSGSMFFPIAMGSSCYYSTSTNWGCNLVKSDGTAKGTLVLKSFSEIPRNLATNGKYLIFQGYETNTGSEVWVTDGTVNGTRLLLDTVPGGGSGFCYSPAVLGGKFYYWTRVGNFYDLWETDGTPANTRMVDTGANLGLSRYWSYPVSIGAKLVFCGYNDNSGNEPWVTDGTAKGTMMLKDIWSGIGSGYYGFKPGVAGGKVFFQADDGRSKTLWVTDGTKTGTVKLKKMMAYYIEGLRNTKVLFRGSETNTLWDWELWESDGTVTGTRRVKDIWPGSGSGDPKYLTSVGSLCFFSANDGGQANTELWVTDGTAAGTRGHTDIAKAALPLPTRDSSPDYMTNVQGVTYFIADDGSGKGLWKTDGTTLGTVKIGGPAGGIIFKEEMSRRVPAVGNKLFFQGFDSRTGYEAWVTDGTTRGTRMLVDAYAGPDSGGFHYPVVMDGACYWWARTSGSSPWYEFFKSDGTTTTKLGRPAAWTANYYWHYPVVLGNKIIFRGYSSVTGYEVWVSDGTLAGTKVLKDTWPGTGSGYCNNPQYYKGKVFFQADDGNGYALWETDGTVAGTRKFKIGVTSFSCPIEAGGRLFWRDSGGINVTDGTTAGTTRITTSTSFSDPCTHGNGKVYFGGRSGNSFALWESDGTQAGTRMVFDPEPMFDQNHPTNIISTGSRHLFFMMKTAAFGEEGCMFDTVTNKGAVLWDAQPGSSSGHFDHPCHAGNGMVLAQIKDPLQGVELFAVDPGASVLGYGRGHGPKLMATDPVLGGSLRFTLGFQPAAARAVMLLAAPTTSPLVLGSSGLFFAQTMVFGTYPVPAAGLAFPLPSHMPELIGAQVAAQAFTAPGTGFAGLDFTQGLVLTLDSK